MMILIVILAVFLNYSCGDETEPFVCDSSNEAVEAELFCEPNNLLLSAMGSKNVFFTDALGVSCNDFGMKMYSDEEEVYEFYSPDGGFTLNAGCPNANHVIVKSKMCIKDGHVPMATLHCHLIKDSDMIEERYNVTSDEYNHMLLNCGSEAAVQKMHFMDAGNGIHTRGVLGCVKLAVADTV